MSTSSIPATEELLSATVIVNDFLETPVQTFFSSVLGGFFVSRDNANDSYDCGIGVQLSNSIINEAPRAQSQSSSIKKPATSISVV